MTMLATYGMDNYDSITEFFQDPLWESISSSSGKTWSFSTTGGRFGGGTLFNINSVGTGTWIAARFIPELPKTIFFSVSINIASNAVTDPFIRFMDTDGVEHANIEILGGTTTMNVNILGSLEGTFAVTTATWHRLEFKLIVDDVAGEFTIRLNGTQVFSQTARDTQNGTNAHVGRIQIQSRDAGVSSDISYDDFTFHDDQGSVNNDFLGDIKIVTLRPNAIGDMTDFTPLSGSNFSNVDEAPGPDGDTTYVESSTAGHQDLYNVEDFVASSGIIHSVTVKAYVKKTDAGVRSIKMLTKSGATTGIGAAKEILSDYTYVQDPVEVNPDTSSAWTNNDIDTIQIGMENT